MIALDLPDLPRWVEAHGIASAADAWRVPLGAAGFAIGHDAARLAVIVHDAAPADAAALAIARPTHTFLVAPEREDLASALRATGRPVERALLHTLDDPDALPDLEGAVALGAATPLAHVPPALAAELDAARTAGAPIWTVWVDGEPVCFAYAPWRSAAWFDVSVDTLPAARQLGLGTLVAAAMIRDELARGRAPVWGADEGNAASLRLARRLGFGAPRDTLLVAAGARA